MNFAKYGLITMTPDPERLDKVVIGIICLCDRVWEVKLTTNYLKILAVNPQYPISHLALIEENIHDAIEELSTLAEAKAYLNTMTGSIQIDEFEGNFAYENEDHRIKQITAIFAESINPKNKQSKSKQTNASPIHIRATLKSQFEHMGLLGKSEIDIDNHKVIPRYPVNINQGLYADFALKNSVMHITETIDFGVSDESFTAKKYEAQAKCLILKAGKELFGDNTKRYVVLAGSSKTNASAYVNLLSANADLYVWESAEDMKSYFHKIQNAAHMAHIQ